MPLACIARAPGVAFHPDKARQAAIRGMSQWFAERARDAGLIDLTALGLRKSRRHRIIEAGGTASPVRRLDRSS